MIRFIALACLAASSLLPAQAQEGLPLLRVYIDTPYFYDILATDIDDGDLDAIKLDLVVEGKEVGSSSIVYSCNSGEYRESVSNDWSGHAANYIPAALMSFADLYC